MADEESDGATLPFSDPIFLKAALLDPSFGTMWLTHDVLVTENIKEAVSMMIQNWILKEVTKTTPTTDEQDQMTMAEADSQPGLFSAYRKKQKKDSSSSPQIQLNHYLDICDGQSCLQFWAMNRHTLPSLFKQTFPNDLQKAPTQHKLHPPKATSSSHRQDHDREEWGDRQLKQEIYFREVDLHSLSKEDVSDIESCLLISKVEDSADEQSLMLWADEIVSCGYTSKFKLDNKDSFI
ncbi:hypothetical protein JOQ06_023302, partial [Pogonophryne albipinna]